MSAISHELRIKLLKALMCVRGRVIRYIELEIVLMLWCVSSQAYFIIFISRKHKRIKKRSLGNWRINFLYSPLHTCILLYSQLHKHAFIYKYLDTCIRISFYLFIYSDWVSIICIHALRVYGQICVVYFWNWRYKLSDFFLSINTYFWSWLYIFNC